MHSRAAKGIPATLPDQPGASKVDKNALPVGSKDNVFVLDVSVDYQKSF